MSALFIAADGFDLAGAFRTCNDSSSLVNTERFQFSRLWSKAWILRKRKFQWKHWPSFFGKLSFVCLSLLLTFWWVNNSAVEISRQQVNVWSAIKWFSLTLALNAFQASPLNSSMQNACVHLEGFAFGSEFVLWWKGQWFSVVIFNQQTSHHWVSPLWRNRLVGSAVNQKVGGSSPPGDADLICRAPSTSATPPWQSQWHDVDLEITMQLIRSHVLKIGNRWVAACHPRLYVSVKRWAVAISVDSGSVNQRIVVAPTFPSCWSKLRSFNCTLCSLSCCLVF